MPLPFDDAMSANFHRRGRASLPAGSAPLFLGTTIGLIVIGIITMAIGSAHHDKSPVVASMLCDVLALVPLFLYRSSVISLSPSRTTGAIERAEWWAKLRASADAMTRLTAFPAPVVLAAIAAAVSATTWSALTHSMLLYSDAQSHLDIARHVTDGLRPGLVQLGSVWLPLPHLLLVPFVALNPLWHSGAAGAIVGGCCFVYSAVRIYTLVDELTGSTLGAWCAFIVYVVNLNVLYLQSTPLTEPVLLACLIGAIYHLAVWMRTRGMRSLALAGFMTFCASLCRYEGWMLVFTATAVVIVWTWLYPRYPKEVQANTLVFGAIGGYGIVLWILYNLIIFHDPLFFMRSPFSAEASEAVLERQGLLPTQGHIYQSVLTYGWDMVDLLGPIVAVAALCAMALVIAGGRARRRTLAVLALMSGSVVFEIVSLWLGQTTIRVPQVAPGGMWNDRYGIMALPLAAVALGTLVGGMAPVGPCRSGGRTGGRSSYGDEHPPDDRRRPSRSLERARQPGCKYEQRSTRKSRRACRPVVGTS